MRIFLIFFTTLLLYGCGTVEVAREVSKVSGSIKKSIQNISKKNDESKDVELEVSEKVSNEQIIIEENINTIKEEKEVVEVEKKKLKKLVKKQKEMIDVNFVGKTVNEIYMRLGDSDLFRLDGNTQTMRYDNKSCRLFLFFNSSVGSPKVEHFEFRDKKGNIISSKDRIRQCYIDFKIT